MEDFILYFQLGWNHILSLDALDHILFLMVLTCRYELKNWKNVVFLVTAFTIGHSITLAISTYNIVRFQNNWVEFLIPFTILTTAIFNLFQKEKQLFYSTYNYPLALSFGLIHGMGFANTLQFMLASTQSVPLPLFSFNIGIEAGQILIVIFIFYLTAILIQFANLKQKWWTTGCSIFCGIIAIYMCTHRWPFESTMPSFLYFYNLN